MSHEQKTKKTTPIMCVVVSDKMNKSRVGVIDRLTKHSRYGKYLRRRTKLMFHDEENQTKVGDKVLVIQSRPRSAHKRFQLLNIVQKADQ